jgi:gamma-glutamyltranspeptidase/glutathione hydrolase
MTRRLDAVHAVMAEQCTGRGRNGVVCAAAPLAALAGAEALRAGGNAFDAVTAAALAESVLLPPKCGLGGDVIAIAKLAGQAEPQALIAVGGAAAGLAAVATSGQWRDVGPNSVGPPAAAAGYEALATLGRLGRERAAAAAVDLARGGFPWAAVSTRLSQHAAALVAEMNPDGCVFYPEGKPIAPGALVTLPRLANALEEWVEHGSDFLSGEVGRAIVEAVRARGGVLDRADLQSARAEWTACAHRDAGDRRVWVTPAPTHGPSLLDAVAPTSGAGELYGHVMTAIRTHRRTLSDPSGTSMVSAADADGNVVVVVHSNSYPRFGSGIVVAEYELVLANRAGRGFNAEVGHPNFPVAGRRPATTLHAWAVSRPGAHNVHLMGATPGGANQMPWNAQAIARIHQGIDEPGVLVTAPLWEWLPEDDGVRIEDGFAADDPTALAALAPATLATTRWGCKSAQQVIRVPRSGEAWVGAADPRTQGAAIGV